jgi:hypothetical protein
MGCCREPAKTTIGVVTLSVACVCSNVRVNALPADAEGLETWLGKYTLDLRVKRAGEHAVYRKADHLGEALYLAHVVDATHGGFQDYKAGMAAPSDVGLDAWVISTLRSPNMHDKENGVWSIYSETHSPVPEKISDEPDRR